MAQVEYDFLFDKSRRLLAIGYNVSDHRQDASYYDLLASEARFSSFVAIAQGALPQETWFALGTPVDHDRLRAGASFMERVNVRIPDAAAGHADL